jgi:hypothetical protein
MVVFTQIDLARSRDHRTFTWLVPRYCRPFLFFSSPNLEVTRTTTLVSRLGAISYFSLLFLEMSSAPRSNKTILVARRSGSCDPK